MSTSATTAERFEAGDLAEIKFPESGPAISFRLLQDAVVPRPVYLISTISSVPTLLEQIQLIERGDADLRRRGQAKQLIQRGSFEHGQTQDL
jgi:hypothetical protein